MALGMGKALSVQPFGPLRNSRFLNIHEIDLDIHSPQMAISQMFIGIPFLQHQNEVNEYDFVHVS